MEQEFKSNKTKKGLPIASDEIPLIFWKYYDLYRRHKITIEEYSENSNLSVPEIQSYLKCICIEQLFNIEYF